MVLGNVRLCYFPVFIGGKEAHAGSTGLYKPVGIFIVGFRKHIYIMICPDNSSAGYFNPRTVNAKILYGFITCHILRKESHDFAYLPVIVAKIGFWCK